MEVENTTIPTEFILLGFYEWPHQQFILFLIFLLIYLMAMTGNLFIIVVISSSKNLHTPMYFFLFNLAILDILLISAIMPKLLELCFPENQSITYFGCVAQVLVFLICSMSETFLLAIMAYDRYVAICCPLRYSYLMNLRICLHLALLSWGFGLLQSLVLTGLIFRCSFVKYKEINHFFCDLDSLIKLSSSGTTEAHMALLVSTFICGFIPTVFILVTYGFVIYNILKIRSNKGKQKAFSTCSSHLTVITLFLGIILRTYFRPKSAYSIQEDKILLLLYTSCIPTLNPLIYSLRNKDVHVAVKKIKKITKSQIFTPCEYFCYKRTRDTTSGIKTMWIMQN